MNMFNFELSDSVELFYGEKCYEGKVYLPGLQEKFYAPKGYWSRKDYIDQWKSSYLRGVDQGGNSVLVTSMRDPQQANFFSVWVLYCSGETVFVQNSIIFMDAIRSGFNIDSVSDYAGDRETIDEDGNHISEWEVKIIDVKSYFDKLLG
ncbi:MULTISPECIES: hypothetical protein [Pseudomonas]|uniref:CdiI C-terminal domain-containing protein n=1 Tax=Pseudomonas quercus TaxID=2722792 RepID=A0ABX0YJT6_9PSED|nr:MULTISPECIES: hypothetical protein [Pseudomonas]MBF7145021.1 hypothetical protein [Pseudomonas sp. LY10J]NJP03612.1 hypothetical protein [Pseudomonas quercus]